MAGLINFSRVPTFWFYEKAFAYGKRVIKPSLIWATPAPAKFDSLYDPLGNEKDETLQVALARFDCRMGIQNRPCCHF